MFNTLKTTITIFTVAAILLVSIAVFWLSIREHKHLYLESVQADLFGLSENMSNDLVSLLASKPDLFDLTNLLLRLDRYKNVKFAVIFDAEWNQLQVYGGNNNVTTADINQFIQELNIKKRSFGVNIEADELIAFKRVGDNALPLGYLLIVNDYQGLLALSSASLIKQVLPLALAIIIFFILCSWWFHNHLLSPLSRLSTLARKIKLTHDYSLRADVKGKEEVAELGRDINDMMETINKQTKKNNSYTKKLQEQQVRMERLANYDTLTGLPNRQFFMQTLLRELSKAKENDKNLILFYLDLDNFKTVNDSHGHDMGDKLLIQMTQRVKKVMRDRDIISRIGGDEFLILLHNEPSNYEIANIANNLVNGLSETYKIKGWEFQICGSLGITTARDSNYNLNEFISNADIAMYHSKANGRGIHTIFVPEMMEDSKRKLLIANSILSAISNNEFELYYQAKVSKDEIVVGYEALLRWQNSPLGFVSPDEFIPIAEQSGKIAEITRWVLERAFRDLETIKLRSGKNITVSINLSAHDISNTTLISDIKTLYNKYNIMPQAIEYEVTESAYLENYEIANKFLNEIGNMGSSIALDDFGTGYSSLGYLTKIPINTLKIDKQFVNDIGISESSTLITETIIEMAKRLDLNICAEGVETRNQAVFLLEKGCHQLQGFLFNRPTPLEKMPHINFPIAT